MGKSTFAIKINENTINRFKVFCDNHGIKYSFFVEEAIKEKLAEEELKDDLLDLKRLKGEENLSTSFEKYLKERNV